MYESNQYFQSKLPKFVTEYLYVAITSVTW
jgi:hypothetical protein